MTTKRARTYSVRRRAAILILTGAVCLLASLTWTPSAVAVIPAHTAVAQVAPEADLRLAEGVLRLTLDEAIELALERNLALSVERYRRSESELRLDEALGIYDFQSGADISAFDETSPAASNLDGADVQQSEGVIWNFNLSRLVPTGGQASLDFNNRRIQTNSTFALLNPSFRTDFDLTFSQPLLRGRGRDTTESGIRIARNNIAISEESFELQVISVLQQVEEGYWNLVEAQAQLGVAKESLALAQKLHEQNKVRVEVGTLAPLELVQSEAGIATRQEEIIRAQGAVGDAEDRLRQLLNLNHPEAWAATIEAETEAEIQPIQLDVERAVVTALQRRPELRSLRRGQENLAITAALRRNQVLPQLNLSVTYGFNGLGGDITSRDFFTGEILFQAPGSYGDALQQVADADFEGWSAGLNFSYPIGNSERKAQMALAEVAVERGEAELADQELAVVTEVRRLARFVDTAAQARESARVSRRLAERNLEAEQKRYENGMSTSFRVLEIQEDLTGARSREVNAITGYRKALILYYRALGTLMQESDVEVVIDDLPEAGDEMGEATGDEA